MSTTDIVLTIILFIVAFAMFLISYLQFKEKMVLLNNAYIYASKQERETMNKKPHYRQSGVVFALIGLTFMLGVFEMIWKYDIIFYCVLAICFVSVIYAIVSSIHIERKSNKQR